MKVKIVSKKMLCLLLAAEAKNHACRLIFSPGETPTFFLNTLEKYRVSEKPQVGGIESAAFGKSLAKAEIL